MPLLRNKFQPYFPDPDSPNSFDCEGSYCHPVQTGDTIRSQFYQTPCGANEITDPQFDNSSLSAEELTNGTFTGNANGWETNSGVLPSDGWAYDTNNIRHTPGTQLPVFQTGLALTAGYYQIEIDITRTSGSVRVRMGDGALQTLSDYYDETGVYTSIVFYSDTLDQVVGIEPHPTDDFDGTVNSISIKEVTYTDWDPNDGWQLVDDMACHIEGETGILIETAANYLLTGGYYSIQGMISGYVAGTCGVYLSTTLVGTISSNGKFHFYTPQAGLTADGVVSFVPTSDFVGCISFPQTDATWWGVRALRNDYIMYLVDENGDETDISYALEYWEDYVTLNFPASEDLIGCYYLTITDTCTITGDNLVTDGDFANGNYDNWERTSGAWQYAIVANQMQFILDPMTGYSNMMSNGDFATGDFTGWTAGANWSVVGNKARHTPGDTATLVQGVNIGAFDPYTQNYYLRFVVSNWTTGTISVQFGTSAIKVYGANDTMMSRYVPGASGVNNVTITPSSTFDGDLDDFDLIVTTVAWPGSALNNIPSNDLIVAGNYQLSFEIVASDNTSIKIGMRLNGQVQPVTTYGTVGVHTFQITDYVPGGQNITLYNVATGNAYQGTVTIDNISLVRVEPFEATYTSECLNFRANHEDTSMMVGYCDQNALGFEFENTGFKLQQRAVVRSMNPYIEDETLIQKNGSGDARITYAAIEKYWNFVTDYGSETFHDAFAAMRRCDHFLIGPSESNGKEYIVSVGEYRPEWRQEGDYSLAPVSVTLRTKTGAQKFNRHL